MYTGCCYFTANSETSLLSGALRDHLPQSGFKRAVMPICSENAGTRTSVSRNKNSGQNRCFLCNKFIEIFFS